MPRGRADLRNHGAADGFPGAVPPDMLCAVAQGASPLSGMAAMYLLMTAFHSAPWLKLISSRCTVPSDPDRSTSFVRQALTKK
jgi:hypothetical protein